MDGPKDAMGIPVASKEDAAAFYAVAGEEAYNQLMKCFLLGANVTSKISVKA